MFARTTQFKLKSGMLEAVTSEFPNIRAQTSQIEGGICNYAMWNEDGAGMTVAIYESAAAAEAAGPKIAAIWGGLADYLAEPPVFSSFTTAANMRE